MNRPATWKIVTFGTALTGLGIAGVGMAAADDDRSAPVPAAVSVAAVDDTADATHDGPDVVDAAPAADASPETADSPAESAVDSPDDATPDTAAPDDADDTPLD